MKNEEEFLAALKEKKVPILVLDQEVAQIICTQRQDGRNMPSGRSVEPSCGDTGTAE